MDIHAPMGPTHSFKDFAIHILIVTIGILIALGLEGIRESVHERHLLAETRTTLLDELREDRKNLVKETANVKDKSDALDAILADYSQLAKNPVELQKRVDDLQPGFYFFSGTAWGAVTSSGILAYMKPDEAGRFAAIYFDIAAYEPISQQARVDWTSVKSFFDSHPTMTAQDGIEGEQRLRTLQMDLAGMKHVDQEFLREMDEALARE
jgi:hypothetical protein